MNDKWIKVEDRQPKRADAGAFRDVLVIQRHVKEFNGAPVAIMLPFHLVRKTRHTHWMKLPDLPREEG